MATTKVDAKIELIRVKVRAEIDRLEIVYREGDTNNSAFHKRQGLLYALKIISEVEERVK